MFRNDKERQYYPCVIQYESGASLNTKNPLLRVGVMGLFLPAVVYVSIPIMIFFGMRHAVDVDHITAIDNLVRMHSANRRARLVGTAFSAGHMSAVLVEMIAIISLVGTIANSEQLVNNTLVRSFQFWGGIVGALALTLIGGLNLYSMKKWGKTGSAILS